MKTAIIRLVSILLAFVAHGAAQTPDSGSPAGPTGAPYVQNAQLGQRADLKTTFTKSFSMESGELESYRFSTPLSNDALDHQWILRLQGDIGFTTDIGSKTTTALEVEGKMWYNTFPSRLAYSALEVNIRTQYYSFYFNRAEGMYSFFGRNDPRLELEVGLFPYKYNPDVRNLGEYLFRSGTYPGYLINEFDFAKARLTGARLSSTLLDGALHQDLLLTAETQLQPFFDVSPSYIACYSFGKVLQIGAGASWAHLISVDEGQTTPHSQGNISGVTNDTLRGQGSGGTDSVASDTSYYTFRGIKLMGRICFDPKQFFDKSGFIGMFGENDLKFYAEAALLGVQNYPAFASTNRWGYDSIWQRIPVVMGVNLPAFKFFDVVALEAEWYGCPYANSYQNVILSTDAKATPTITTPPLNVSADDYYKTYYLQDNWKWSLYVKKSFGNGFQIVAQAARDHMRTMSSFLENSDREEALRENKNWYWMVKLGYCF